jgi:sugar/nucleoside kinase (ribokinase family)
MAMSILVSGLINLETTLKVEGFPLPYQPVQYPFFGVNTTVAGVGYNISKALASLGQEVDFLSIIGKDEPSHLVLHALQEIPLSETNVLSATERTAQSVILYEESGRRAIYTDLKDIQDQIYPTERFEAALVHAEAAILSNVNFSRLMLAKAKNANIPVITDVHTISDIEDGYNRDFMAQADVLFQSHERLPCSPKEWVHQVSTRYGTPIIVIGMGQEGALISVKGEGFAQYRAIQTRPIVSTIGAGDALLSAFTVFYLKTTDPFKALQKAMVFASHKIGAAGAAEGFLSLDELEELAAQHTPETY